MPRSVPRHPAAGRRLVAAATVAATATAGVLVGVPAASAVSPDVVISEVYGGGGNSGAVLTNDFIELYNAGTETVDVDGWSVQYASSTGTSWQVTGLDGQIPAGESYLVQEAQGTGGTTPLPPPDATGTIAMSASNGKVALVVSSAALTCGSDCAGTAAVYDFVGYGSANDFEGTAAAPALSNTTSATRDALGTDTDDNAADFTDIDPPTPDSCGEACEGEVDPPPDPVVVTIPEIQGAAHLSTYDTQLVQTSGVTTALNSNGYYLQDPAGDDTVTTSNGIYVFTGSSGAKPAVGDAVTVTGTVDEFRPGSADGDGLNITEITDSTFTVDATGVALPEPLLISPAGLQAPEDIIDNDSATRIDIEVQGTYQPTEDAIDFYEQFESMLLQVNSPKVVGPTNDFGELPVLPRGRHGYVNSVNGGVVYAGYDMPNPRRIILDDTILGAGNMPAADTGDQIDGPVVGVLDYSFNNFKLQVLAAPVIAAGDTVREVTDEPVTRELVVGTFNVENLDPTDPPEKFGELAEIVVASLRSPDILALEEVQDNNGSQNDGTVDASVTLDQFTAAITAAGGPDYEWTQINPENNSDGGQPGGNIRVAFLYRTDRGVEFVQRGEGDATTPTQVVVGADGEPELTLSPGRVDPTNPAWEDSRKPLAGEFTWRGESIIVIANHFASKGGDEPLFGRWQPPTRSSEDQRHLQAQVVNDFVDDILAVDAGANVAVVGDINDFEFSETIDILTGDGAALADLVQYLRPPQRYTFIFDGNSQVLDHILVSPSLAPVVAENQRPVRVGRDYDILHVNADFADQVSDHDPQVVRLRLG